MKNTAYHNPRDKITRVGNTVIETCTDRCKIWHSALATFSKYITRIYKFTKLCAENMDLIGKKYLASILLPKNKHDISC